MWYVLHVSMYSTVLSIYRAIHPQNVYCSCCQNTYQALHSISYDTRDVGNILKRKLGNLKYSPQVLKFLILEISTVNSTNQNIFITNIQEMLLENIQKVSDY